MKLASIFNVTTVGFLLFLSLSFVLVVTYIVVLWLFYVYKLRNLFYFFPSTQDKKRQRIKVQRELMRQKKDFSRILMSTNFCSAQKLSGAID